MVLSDGSLCRLADCAKVGMGRHRSLGVDVGIATEIELRVSVGRCRALGEICRSMLAHMIAPSVSRVCLGVLRPG